MTARVLDLFAGAGGAALGLHREGFEHVACGTAPNCRLSVTVTPDGDQFRVAINVVEVRKRWLGGERTSLVGAPTFLVPQNEQAEFFVGGEVPIPGSEPVAFREVGLHIQARVSNPA